VILNLLEKLYWRWMDGPLMTCPECGEKYRRDSIRGMCKHAYEKFKERA